LADDAFGFAAVFGLADDFAEAFGFADDLAAAFGLADEAFDLAPVFGFAPLVFVAVLVLAVLAVLAVAVFAFAFVPMLFEPPEVLPADALLPGCAFLATAPAASAAEPAAPTTAPDAAPLRTSPAISFAFSRIDPNVVLLDAFFTMMFFSPLF
jgi:hypothetical protein